MTEKEGVYCICDCCFFVLFVCWQQSSDMILDIVIPFSFFNFLFPEDVHTRMMNTFI